MPFDGFVTRATVYELAKVLIGSRIHKIYQPHSTDLIVNVRSMGKNLSLLISANPTYPRIHITNKSYLNPTEPPMFCMLLRKHLEGGIIEAVKQVDNERIIHIDILVRDELGDIQSKKLIIEIMGRHSNIILINPENNLILDGIKHVPISVSSYRQILPGRSYINPPEQHKLNPLEVCENEFYAEINLNAGKVDKQLVDLFTGLSPALAKEIIHAAGLSTKENIWRSFASFVELVKNDNYQPAIVSNAEKSDFYIFPLEHFANEYKSYDSMNDCLEAFYSFKAERDTVRQKALDLSRILVNEKNRNEKKIEHLLKDIEAAKNAEKFQLYGELLTANLHQVKRGDKGVEVINYYDEAQSFVSIPLDPLRSPSENAQGYFKKYNKLKNSIQYINNQLAKTKEEIDYLDTLITQLDSASVNDIEGIREELVEQGYLRDRKKQKRKKKTAPELEQFTSSEGHIIIVGKNNKQNEYLTNRLANPYDTWLHTKDIPGSHVVIRGKDYGDKTLTEAAMLAAYFSKAKNSSQVPVDYTAIKYVKKPSGAKPGYVIYDNQRTIYVTPEEQLIDQLRGK